MEHVKLSIAMATYNGAKFLPQQLDSLVAQSVLPDELIVSDDGSTDDTIAILTQFQECAPFPVRIRRNVERLGYVRNFLEALRLCSGNVMAFCDQDDVWHPQKLAVVLDAMHRHQSAIVIHASTVVDEALSPQGSTLPSINRSETLARGNAGDGPMHSFPLGFCLVFRRDVAEEALRRLADYPEQYAFYFGHEIPIYLTAKAMGPSTYLAQPLAFYRRHGSNASRGALPDSARSRLRQGAQEYQDFAKHQYIRREFLQWMARVGDPKDPVNGFFRDLSVISGQHAHLLARRADLYRQATLRKRIVAFSTLVAQRGYRHRAAGGLGVRSMAKDLWSVFRAR